MTNLKKSLLFCGLILTTTTLNAAPVKSEKHAKRATEYRQAIFKLLGSNMGPMGAMAKGKIPLNVEVVKKNSTRIHQLSQMIADYTKADTRGHNVNTEALDAIWKKPEAFAGRISDLEAASGKLIQAAESNNESAIKKAIAGVGKTCGGCHDDFKAD